MHVIDATRITDGERVFIKKISKRTEEISIAQIFSQDGLRKDANNHCVPVLDVFDDDENENIAYLVMPFLRCIENQPLNW